MLTATGRTFRSGNSEALRLPKDLGFGIGVELTLVKTGEVLTIKPRRPTVSEMLDELAKLPKPDHIEVRDDEAPQGRDDGF